MVSGLRAAVRRTPSHPRRNHRVLARAGGDERRIRFADLSLAADREYLVYGFWTRSLAGSFQEAFTPGPIDPSFAVQVFCIRVREPRPQLLATNRHVSCGGVDLADVAWRGGALGGQSDLVANDTYEVYLTEPPGWRFVDAAAEGAELVGNERSGAVRVVRLRAAHATRAAWRVRWERGG